MFNFYSIPIFYIILNSKINYYFFKFDLYFLMIYYKIIIEIHLNFILFDISNFLFFI